jgi:large subunit ribosomal protein L4
VVATRDDELTFRSLRNIPNVHLLAHDQLNTYDVLISDDVIFTETALRAFLESRQVEAEWAEGKPAARKAAAKKTATKSAAKAPSKAAADKAADEADADDAEKGDDQ